MKERMKTKQAKKQGPQGGMGMEGGGVLARQERWGVGGRRSEERMVLGRSPEILCGGVGVSFFSVGFSEAAFV